jgi:hypothetical protein
MKQNAARAVVRKILKTQDYVRPREVENNNLPMIMIIDYDKTADYKIYL